MCFFTPDFGKFSWPATRSQGNEVRNESLLQLPNNGSWRSTIMATKTGRNTEGNTTCEPRKKPSYFPLYWLVNRDPCNGFL